MVLCCSIEDSPSLHRYDVMRGGGVAEGLRGSLEGYCAGGADFYEGLRGIPLSLFGGVFTLKRSVVDCILPFWFRC